MRVLPAIDVVAESRADPAHPSMTTATKTRRSAPTETALFSSTIEPTDEEFRLGLGPSFGRLNDVVNWFRAREPSVTAHWKFAPISGWYQIYVLKKRRMFYLIPRRDGFRMVILLGDRAIATLREGPLGGGVDALLGSAKRYPEGTAFTLESEGFYPEVAIALLTAKMAV